MKVNSDLKFIRKLDKKLHYVDGPYENRANVSGKIFYTYCDSFREEKVSSAELKRLKKIVSNNNSLVFYPVNTNNGFSVGFGISYIRTYGLNIIEPVQILLFKEDQLPEGENFDSLEDFFTNPRNLEKNEFAGLPEIRDHEYYVY